MVPAKPFQLPRKSRFDGLFYALARGLSFPSSAFLIIYALIWYFVNINAMLPTMARPMKNSPEPLTPAISPIGDRLARIRKLRGYTQESLAEAMGISRKQITDYETDRVHMNDEMIIRFSLVLKISSDVLLGLKEIDFPIEAPNIRFTRRLKELENLPESKKRAVIKILDEFIKQD
jgi:transcriptional regulator with XRE-family HTH domain